MIVNLEVILRSPADKNGVTVDLEKLITPWAVKNINANH
jgi:hypothetical protein